jgi:hemin uptake protein HemP
MVLDMTREEETLKPSAPISRNDMWVYRSEELFGSKSAIQINHHGVIYTLRITQLGKLILTK